MPAELMMQGPVRYRVVQPPGGGFLGRGGPPPRDIIAILVVLFVTYTLQFFDSTAALPELLRLT